MEKDRIYPDDADRLLSIDEVAARLRTSPFLEKYDGCDMYDVLQQAVGAEK